MLHLLAAADPGSGDIQGYLALFNVPVYIALVVALLKGWLVTGREYDRVVADRDAERAERIALQKTLTDTVMPTNQDVQTTLRQVTDMWMTELLADREDARRDDARREGGDPRLRALPRRRPRYDDEERL